MNDLGELEKVLGYEFKDQSLLKTAVTHSSYANDYFGNPDMGNERMEFLGDAILDMVVGAELYKEFPAKQEGFLSKLRSEIVCEESLAEAAFELGINEYLLLGKGEESKGGRLKPSLVSDLVEAIIASVYIDGGIEKSIEVVHRIMDGIIKLGCEGKLAKDYKTELQEHYQKLGKKPPNYKILKESGPDHDKTFEAGAFEDDELLGKGKGKTKKEAENNAAKAAFENARK